MLYVLNIPLFIYFETLNLRQHHYCYIQQYISIFWLTDIYEISAFQFICFTFIHPCKQISLRNNISNCQIVLVIIDFMFSSVSFLEEIISFVIGIFDYFIGLSIQSKLFRFVNKIAFPLPHTRIFLTSLLYVNELLETTFHSSSKYLGTRFLFIYAYI